MWEGDGYTQQLETVFFYIHGAAGTGSPDFLPKEMSGKKKQKKIRLFKSTNWWFVLRERERDKRRSNLLSSVKKKIK